MNRLEKKCCIASGGFHLLLLLLIVVVGMGFFSSRTKIEDPQAITMIPLDARLTDGPSQTGGTPAATPPPAAPTPPAPPAPPAPPEVVEPTPPEPPKQTLLEKIFNSPPPKPVKEDEPAVEPTPKKVIIKATSDEPTPKTSTKPQVEVSKKVVKLSSKKPTTTSDNSAAKAEADAIANAKAIRKARADAIGRALGNLENSLSSGTEVSVPGPGAGTFLNYAEAVKRIYTEAWIAPTDVTDDEATAKVSVTISRDGNVVLARMKTPSGSAAVDRSVQETIRRVKFVAPFPDGAKDSERTFIINFNLKAKKLLG